jgi:hypothetical protein
MSIVAISKLPNSESSSTNSSAIPLRTTNHQRTKPLENIALLKQRIDQLEGENKQREAKTLGKVKRS